MQVHTALKSTMTICMFIIMWGNISYSYGDNKSQLSFINIKTIKIELDETYIDSSDNNKKVTGVALKFKSLARDALKYTGVKILDKKEKTADTTLRIVVRGKAMGTHYSSSDREIFCYHGASISGDLLLLVGQNIISKKSFSSITELPRSILICKGTTPQLAPWEETLLDGYEPGKKSFRNALWHLVGANFGYQTIISAFNDKDLQGLAAVAMGRLKDGRFIAPLAEALKRDKGHDRINHTIPWALGAINDPRAIEPLVSFLYNQKTGTSATQKASEALVALGDEGLQAISEFIKDKEFQWLDFISRALRFSKNKKKAAELLAQIVLYRWNGRTESIALESLGIFKDKRFVEILLPIMAKEDYGTLEVLRGITEEDFGYNSIKWNKWWKLNKSKYPKQFTLDKNKLPSHDTRKTWIDPVTGMEFVKVKGGCYMMGSSRYHEAEKPVHKVCVNGFWIAKYEVTNRQYRLFQPNHSSKDYKEVNLNDNEQPVVFVSHKDARAFVNWMNTKGNGTFDLPTEAQWEYAARAGATTERYWGDSADSVCDFANVYDYSARNKYHFNWMTLCTDDYAASAPVGSFQPNKFGLHDMLGNVWEWCKDVYDESGYSKHNMNNPLVTSGSSSYVIRGCSWANTAYDVRSANRFGNEVDTRMSNVGFRVCLPLRPDKK